MRVGDQIGEYEIIERMATGGMSTIFRARHRLMNRIVVLKVIREELAADSRLPMMFRREIEASARLSHPNVLTVFDAGTGPTGSYLVSEYLPGGDLGTRVNQKGPLPVTEALKYAAESSRALEAAHSAGIIHRDVKPSNLLLDHTESVKLIDFGIVKLLRDSGEAQREHANRSTRSKSGDRPSVEQTYFPEALSASEATGTNWSADLTFVPAPPRRVFKSSMGFSERVVASQALLTLAPQRFSSTHMGSNSTGPVDQTRYTAAIGTPAYMSPEQLAGQGVDCRTDIYAMGATLFFLLTGESVLAGNPRSFEAIADRKMRGETRIPSALRDDIPEQLDRVVRRMTALDPDDRFDSMKSVLWAIEAVNAEPKVFFSYRREDSLDATDRLYTSMSKKIDPQFLFLDVDSIPAGVDFRQYLEAEVGKCDVVLAIIGDHWLASRDGRRRIDDPLDFVRNELLFALRHSVPTIPVLVGNARMPGACQLPDEIEAIARFHATEVRAGPDYELHVDKLITSIFNVWRSSDD